MEKYKYVSDSEAQQIQIVMQKDINGYKRLFGGRLAEWIDIVAAVVARRHSEKEVTTVCIDNLHFKAAAYVNNTLLLKGKITYAGNTSMEVKVETFVEKLNGERNHINTAYIVFVAIDENGKPSAVPKLMLKTDEERKEWEKAQIRQKNRMRYTEK
jgi:acyl-CoA hydrolase